MPKLYHREYDWDISIVNQEQNDTIYCRKAIEIITKEERINSAFTINFFISKNPADEMIRKLLNKNSLFDKIKSIFFPPKEELLLSQLNIFTHFCVYFIDCSINVGKAKIKLYTNYNETIEAIYNYSYENETDPIIDFYTNNRFEANKIFAAFLNNIIEKVEFEPVEQNTFDRVYFDIKSEPFSLEQEIQNIAKNIGFTIKYRF